MSRGEIPCRIAITKCWFSSMLNRVPDKHAAGNLMFTLFRFKFLTIRKSGSKKISLQWGPQIEWGPQTLAALSHLLHCVIFHPPSSWCRNRCYAVAALHLRKRDIESAVHPAAVAIAAGML